MEMIGVINTKSVATFAILCFFHCSDIQSKEYHVAKEGSDTNTGTKEYPFKTIATASQIALPGDTITVHKGTYREWVNPPRGGESFDQRIVYRAAINEDVIIKGSEVVKNWKDQGSGLWSICIPNDFFGNYNPYNDPISGDWFKPLGRKHHTGEIYLNGMALFEEVSKLKAIDREFSWYCEVDDIETRLWANFGMADPNKELVEINVRQACFYPENPGQDFITVSGFTMRHAASQWAPPTAEQKALIGTHWSKGWIIENNIISDSKCVGLTLGKYGDSTDNSSGDSAEGYIGTIERALEKGWTKEIIGSHIIRNNTIYNCGAAGICGSLGSIFSEIIGNHIYNINIDKPFTGHEMAGIKIHAPIDVLIKGNCIHHTSRGIWLDWMTQGTRVSSNLLYKNIRQDLYVEVNHGPFVIDNNLFLSRYSLKDRSEGGAYAHNLFHGKIDYWPDGRLTPYHKEHSTEIAGIQPTIGSDSRFYNNFITSNGLSDYNNAVHPCIANSNIYIFNAKPLESEEDPFEINFGGELFKLEILEENESLTLIFQVPVDFSTHKNSLITTEFLGKTVVSDAPFLDHNGLPLLIDRDYNGQIRDKENPTAGPFEFKFDKKLVVEVW